MPRITMVGVTAPSHVLPGLPVIEELVRRGHDVTYVVGDRLRDLVAPTGARVLTHPSILPNPQAPEGEVWPDDIIAAQRLFLEEQIAVLPHVLDDGPADLYLYDIGGYAGKVAARHVGVPAVQLSPTFVAWEDYEEDMAEFNAERAQLPGFRDYRARFDGWIAPYGFEPDGDAFASRPEHAIALIPKVMQPNADRVRDEVRFVGTVFGPAATQGWAPPGDGRPMLYIAFGTAYHADAAFHRRCVEAFADDWHVVISVGEGGDLDGIGPVPSSVELHRWVPQVAVLEHADVFITHAGMGSAGQGLWCGTPMVAIPQAVEQFQNADSLVDLGVARRLDMEDATTGALREAVTAVHEDPAIAERAEALRDEVRAGGGTAGAADAIEALL